MNVNDLFYPDDSDEDYWDDNETVQLVEIDLVEGTAEASTTLIYHDEQWKLFMYSPYHINHKTEISEYEVKEILDKLANEDIESFDWTAQAWVYVE